MDEEFRADVVDWLQSWRKSIVRTESKKQEPWVAAVATRPALTTTELPVRAPAALQFGDGDEGGDVLPLCTADPWDDERREAAEQAIVEQGQNVSDFWAEKYRTKAGGFWHQFYKRNTDNFYKDRHYLHVEFPELLQQADAAVDDTHRMQLLEVGCGVGNAVVPLLELNPNLYANAVDFAKSAIEILRQHNSVTKHPGRLIANVCDVIHDDIPLNANAKNNLDIVLCMFVISAIAPEQQQGVFKKLADELVPGGKLLFRDYGRYDEAQLRFKKGSKLQDNLYVRNDGTMAYYFELDELTKLCENAGLQPVPGRCGYLRIQQANRAQAKARHRVFVQAVFEKVAA